MSSHSALESEPAHIAPLSLEQAAVLLESFSDAKLTFEIALRPNVLKAINVPPRTYLHFEAAFLNGVAVPENTKVCFVDEFGKQVSLKALWGFVAFRDVWLTKNKSNSAENLTANLIAGGRVFFLFPFRPTLVSHLPLQVSALLEKLADMTSSNLTATDSSNSLTGPTTVANKESLFNAKDIRYDFSFTLKTGAKLELNEDTTISVDPDQGSAAVIIKGVRDYTVATVTGTDLILNNAMLSTKPSDIDFRVTLNRKPDGVHHIAFNKSILRGVEFKSSDFTAPAIQKLRIDAKDYDFVITINPHDTFTLKMLIAKITERVGNPELMAKLRRKMAEKAESTSEGPSELVIDSARWNIVDYVTHDFKGVFETLRDLPHIREHLDDPAVQKLAREGVPHMQAFIISTRLQLASSYDRVRLKELVMLALSHGVIENLLAADSERVRLLLKAINLSHEQVSTFVKGKGRDSSGFRDKVEAIATTSDEISGNNLEKHLRELGNGLNFRERSWLRRVWVDAGGLDEDGRAYALMAHFVEALATGVLSDPNAPPGLKEMMKQVPLGENVDGKIAVASDNVRGAIWAALGVLKEGWLPVSEKLEASVRRIFGENIANLGPAVFRTSAKNSKQDAFLRGDVRFIGNGEEFFQQIMHLLDETERVFSDREGAKCTIVLNYWSFEAIEATEGSDQGANVWGLKVANRLKELAMSGFTVSIVVDEKNSPSRKGQVLLKEIADEVQARGKGVFQLHPWVPRTARFPTGTHVKYFCTPLGVIAGGSNLGDHYAHWSDTNLLLLGRDVVQCFAGHHFAILHQQREVGHAIADIPTVERLAHEAWNPLAVYDYHGHDVEVFNPEWQPVDLRVFRDQGGDAGDRILVEFIAALDSARGISEDDSLPPQTVYISNCYVVLTQPIDEHPIARALRRALERGVNVEILSNTKDSIDVPIAASPIVKSMYLILAIGRDLAKSAALEGRRVGRVTLHMPDAEFVKKDDKGIPEILIHDKVLFVGELALVKTTNLHPRSYTLEQELLTEIVGPSKPPEGAKHEEFMARAQLHLERVKKTPGGSRITDIDSVLAPVNWQGSTPPELWGPGAMLYLQYVEKRYKYCYTFSSDSDEDVRSVEARLDESASASLLDLMMNIF